MSEILKVENLSKNYILNDISFSVEEGEMVAIMGPSGSGKSTLLYNISGMDKPDAGSVTLNDQVITDMTEDEKAVLRLENMGFVFQQMNVMSNLNIIENIMFPALHSRQSKKGKLKKADIKEKSKKLMEDFAIENLADRAVTNVSGGQLQRACICRSLMMDPTILFADEPTGALNKSSAEDVISVFLQINQQGTTVVMVTHDAKIASRCNRILYILDGQIKGELTLSRYSDQENNKDREKTVNDWLANMGW